MNKEEFVCLNCSAILIQHHCKVRCPRCGYFEDCSDGMQYHPNITQIRNPKPEARNTRVLNFDIRISSF